MVHSFNGSNLVTIQWQFLRNHRPCTYNPPFILELSNSRWYESISLIFRWISFICLPFTLLFIFFFIFLLFEVAPISVKKDRLPCARYQRGNYYFNGDDYSSLTALVSLFVVEASTFSILMPISIIGRRISRS